MIAKFRERAMILKIDTRPQSGINVALREQGRESQWVEGTITMVKALCSEQKELRKLGKG